jgi:hypothetical protein
LVLGTSLALASLRRGASSRPAAVKLRYAPGACSLAPYSVIRKAAIDAALDKLARDTHLTSEGKDFHPINPQGSAPAPELRESLVKNVLQRLSGRLGDQHYLMGDRFIAADPCAFVIQLWAQAFELDRPLPIFIAFADRARTRTHAQKTLGQEGLPGS